MQSFSDEVLIMKEKDDDNNEKKVREEEDQQQQQQTSTTTVDQDVVDRSPAEEGFVSPDDNDVIIMDASNDDDYGSNNNINGDGKEENSSSVTCPTTTVASAIAAGYASLLPPLVTYDEENDSTNILKQQQGTSDESSSGNSISSADIAAAVTGGNGETDESNYEHLNFDTIRKDHDDVEDGSSPSTSPSQHTSTKPSRDTHKLITLSKNHKCSFAKCNSDDATLVYESSKSINNKIQMIVLCRTCADSCMGGTDQVQGDINDLRSRRTKKRPSLDRSPNLLVFEGVPDNKERCNGWGDGWMKRTYQRTSGMSAGRVDHYWFTPAKRYKLRSIYEVNRFLLALQAYGGDEQLAFQNMDKFGKHKQHTKRPKTQHNNDIDPRPSSLPSKINGNIRSHTAQLASSSLHHPAFVSSAWYSLAMLQQQYQNRQMYLQNPISVHCPITVGQGTQVPWGRITRQPINVQQPLYYQHIFNPQNQTPPSDAQLSHSPSEQQPITAAEGTKPPSQCISGETIALQQESQQVMQQPMDRPSLPQNQPAMAQMHQEHCTPTQLPAYHTSSENNTPTLEVDSAFSDVWPQPHDETNLSPSMNAQPDASQSNHQIFGGRSIAPIDESPRDSPVQSLSPTSFTGISALRTVSSRDFLRKLSHQQYPSAIAFCSVLIRALPHLYVVTDPSLNNAMCHAEVAFHLNQFPHLAHNLGLSDSDWRSLTSTYVACCGKPRTLLFLDICKHLSGLKVPSGTEFTVFASAFYRTTHIISFAFELEQAVSFLREEEGSDWFREDVSSGTSYDTLRTYVKGKVDDFLKLSPSSSQAQEPQAYVL